jgi:hypothetical protein
MVKNSRFFLPLIWSEIYKNTDFVCTVQISHPQSSFFHPGDAKRFLEELEQTNETRKIAAI